MNSNSLPEEILFLVFERERKGRTLPRIPIALLAQLLPGQVETEEIRKSIEEIKENGWGRVINKGSTQLALTQKGVALTMDIARGRIRDLAFRNRKRTNKELSFQEIKQHTGLNRKLISVTVNKLHEEGFFKLLGTSKVWITKQGIRELSDPPKNYLTYYKNWLLSHPATAILVLSFTILSSVLLLASRLNLSADEEILPATLGKAPNCVNERDSSHKIFALLTDLDRPHQKWITEGVWKYIHEVKYRRNFQDLGLGQCHSKPGFTEAAIELGEQRNADLVIWRGATEKSPPMNTIEMHFEPIGKHMPWEIIAPVKDFEFQLLPIDENPRVSFSGGVTEDIGRHLYLILGVLSKFLKEYTLSNYFFRSWQEVNSEAPNQQLQSQVQFLMGDNYSLLGSSPEALQEYEFALVNDPSNIQATFNQAVLLAQEGDYKKAEKLFNQTLEMEADNIIAKHNLGYSYYQLGDLQKAIRTFEEVLEMIYQGNAFFPETGAYESAVSNLADRVYRNTSPTDPTPNTSGVVVTRPQKSKDSPYEEGLEWMDWGNYYEAIKSFTRAISTHDSPRKAHYQRGICHLEKGYFKRAAKDFDKIKSLENPGPDFDLYYGKALQGARRHSEAIDYFSNQLEKDRRRKIGGEEALLKRRGISYKALGRYELAIDDFLEMTEQRAPSSRLEGYLLCGQTYNLWKKPKVALEYYLRYLEQVPRASNNIAYHEAIVIAASNKHSSELYALLELYCQNGGSIQEVSYLREVEKYRSKKRFQGIANNCH